MSLPARLTTFLFVLGALGSLGGGVALGMTLGERASRPGHDELVIANPALATTGAEPALRSPAGFTGFDGTGSLGGTAVRTGTVAAAANGTFDVNSGGSTLGVRTASTGRLFRLRRAGTPLAAGDAIAVRVQADGAATAVLRVPRDLNEGAARPSATATAAAGTATSTPAR